MTYANSSRRGAWTRKIAAASVATLLTAPPNAIAQEPPSADRQDQLLAYAQCMRENGYAEFPDPSAEGHLRLQIDASTAPRFEAAREACRELSPMGLETGPPDPERMERLVGFAQCMRDNGIPDFPDPDVQGQFNLAGSDIDDDGPAIQSGMRDCIQASGGFGALGGVRITR